MTEYKEIEMKEALMRYADGEIVYYRYFTNGGYRWIGSLGLDHLRRNPERYTFYIEEPKKTLWDKRFNESIVVGGKDYSFEEKDVKEEIQKHTIDKVFLIKLINKHFVCGYEQGLSGAVHSVNCRKCKLLKELKELENY